MCEQQRKNILDKDACVLRKMTKIDEQQRENEKLGFLFILFFKLIKLIN